MRRGVPAFLLVFTLLVPPVASMGAMLPKHPTSDGRSSDGPTDSDVRELVRLVNEHRASLGLGKLTWSSRAAEVATAHSRDMERRDFFSHTNPDHASPFDRLRLANVTYVRAGENIAYGYSSPQELLQGWLDSPGHRKNLENPKYTQHGIGVSGTMWTHLFVTPPETSRDGHVALASSSRRITRIPASPSRSRRADDRIAAAGR